MRFHRVVSALVLAAVSLAARPQSKPVLPPAEAGAKAALEASPRHGEWVDIDIPGSPVKLKSWVVYPEVKDKAPVVIVIHEIFGETDWLRSVTDQLAAEGFIAIAPDLLSGYGANGGGTDALGDQKAIGLAIRNLKADEVSARLDAVRAYAAKLPSATDKFGVVGFCWGGGMAFSYAIHQPDLGAAVAFYGTNPSKLEDVEKIHAAIQGHFGGNDNRVTSTVAPCVALMKQAGKTYDPHVYDGAGHGFLRQQGGQNGANLKAAEAAWPATVAFLREHLK
jgi:carboxymethylenebutenolidase